MGIVAYVRGDRAPDEVSERDEAVVFGRGRDGFHAYAGSRAGARRIWRGVDSDGQPRQWVISLAALAMPNRRPCFCWASIP